MASFHAGHQSAHLTLIGSPGVHNTGDLSAAEHNDSVAEVVSRTDPS